MNTLTRVDHLDEIKAQIAQIAILRQQGFVVVRALVDPADCSVIQQVAETQLYNSANQAAPIEFESDFYNPDSDDSNKLSATQLALDDKPVTLRPIHQTRRRVRRLLDAYQRDVVFRNSALSPQIRHWIYAYFGEPVLFSRAHHNCIMTKHPGYGITGWHRDRRYWSFERDDLVSAWLALGTEKAENGALWFIPGSHQLALSPTCFDDAKFFRTDLSKNQALIRTAVSVELNAGDVIFFHCNTLHSAQRNLTDAIKFSAVFTYHAQSNAPQPGTRSISKPGILLG